MTFSISASLKTLEIFSFLGTVRWRLVTLAGSCLSKRQENVGLSQKAGVNHKRPPFFIFPSFTKAARDINITEK